MYRIHAPAKVNLYLHVGPRLVDGRHPLDSLVVFSDARASDVLTFSPGGQGLEFDVVVDDALAETLGPPKDNLVLKAALAFCQATGKALKGELVLEKRLPIAAGIGGGSSDAAALLHLLNSVFETGLSLADLIEIGTPLGGDIPACIAGAPVIMRDDGRFVKPHDLSVSNLPSVLVWPREPCPTGPVFQRFDMKGPPGALKMVKPPAETQIAPYVRVLSEGYRNDLAGPAREIVPVIWDVLNALAATKACLSAAVSGSGATCFGLYESEAAADTAAEELQAANKGWWICRTNLGMAGFDPIGFKI